MSQIGLNISVSGLSGKLLIRWKKASSPLAEVGRSAAFDFPYDDVYAIINLSPIVYIVELWRSDDGIALSQLIKDWSIDASKETVTSIQTYQYVVDRGNTEGTIGDGTYWLDPVDTNTILIDERLDGFTKAQLIVHEAGFGNKLDAEYDLYAGGGIELLGGKTFDSGVAWFITVASSEIVTIDPGTGGEMFTGVEVITANRDVYVSPSDNLYNKLVIANFAGTSGQIIFPDLTLIPDDTHVTFQTQLGSQNYLTLQFDSGDAIRFLNANVNVLYLAKCEKISLYFKGGVGYVIDYDGNAIRRGAVAADYSADRSTGAFLFADESIGVLSRTNYPGMYAFVAALTGTAVCPLGTGVGQWSYDSGGSVYPNKRKYGIDAVAFTFRVPHLSGMVAKYGAPGTYEADAVGNHTGTITVPKGNNYTGGPNNDRIGNGAASPENKIIPGITVTTGNIETRVKSYLQKPFIYL